MTLGALPVEPRAIWAGRYRLHGRLGEGVRCVVHVAEDLARDGRRVALKCARDDRWTYAAASREAESAAAVGHPAVVQVLEVGEEPAPHIVMEWIEGATFREAMSRWGRPALGDLAEFGAVVADAVAWGAARGVVHGDLGPRNVMVAVDGGWRRPRVIDYGGARPPPRAAPIRGRITGTLSVLSPERCRGAPPSPASDVYALGCLLHLGWAARAPFVGQPEAVLRQHLVAVPSVPLRGAVAPPPSLRVLLARMLAKDPADRPDPGEAADALRALGGGVDGDALRRGNAARLDRLTRMLEPSGEAPAGAGATGGLVAVIGPPPSRRTVVALASAGWQLVPMVREDLIVEKAPPSALLAVLLRGSAASASSTKILSSLLSAPLLVEGDATDVQGCLALLRAGAHDVLPKEPETELLARRLQALSRGRSS